MIDSRDIAPVPDSDERREFLAALLKRYHARFPDEISRHQVLESQLRIGEDICVRTNTTGHVTTSITVLNSARDRVLLIHHKFFEKWLPPGGHYEPPGTFWESAVRELAEETGLVAVAPHPWTVENQLPVDIDTHPIPANPGKREGAHLHHDIRYLAIASDSAPLCADLDEVHAVRWALLTQMRDSPDERMRALHAKLVVLDVVK